LKEKLIIATFTNVSTNTLNHTIIIKEGSLTITGERDTLDPDETQQLLEVLLIWRYGLELVSPNELEG
jgi:hypothetical protein